MGIGMECLFLSQSVGTGESESKVLLLQLQLAVSAFCSICWHPNSSSKIAHEWKQQLTPPQSPLIKLIPFPGEGRRKAKCTKKHFMEDAICWVLCR